MGPFCRLCNSSADVWTSDGSSLSASRGRVFYVGATQSDIAHCEQCGQTELWGGLLLVVLTFAGILSQAVFDMLRRQFQHHHRATLTGSWITRLVSMLRLGLQVTAGDLKLVIAFLLIVTSITEVYGIEFPQQTHQLLAALRFPISLGLDNVFDGFMFQCIGLDGYIARAVSWMCLPLYIYALALMAAALRACCAKEAITWRLLVERTAETMFRALFLLYPTLIRIAFSAFDCHTFKDGPSWMKADVAIRCDSAEHERAKACAGIMIVVYVAGEEGSARAKCSRHT